MAQRFVTCGRLAAAVLVLATPLTWSFAHEDDPKVLDRVPPYDGKGWRAGEDDGSGPPIPFDSFGVELKAWISLSEFGGGINNANDCWGYVSASGREYAIVGLSTGTAFVDITIPEVPAIVAFQSGPTSLWRDIKTYQDYAYIVSEGGDGIQVVDLSQLDSGQITLVRETTSGGTTATHNVAINEDSGYLYRCGGGNKGIRIYDIATNPRQPHYVTDWSDRYVHDAQIVTYHEGPYAGREIAFCCGGYNGGSHGSGLDIIDVTDKSNLVHLARLRYTRAAYSHQVWLSEDRHYAYLDDELDEGNDRTTRTIVIDVSDLENPVEVSSFTNGNTAIGHNLYVKGNFIYEANYRSGLRVFDASTPTQPLEIAYFDTWEGDDNARFNGMWSNYPYFPSGTVICSDIEKGLFIFEVDIPSITFGFPDGRPDMIDPSGQGVLVELIEHNGKTYQPGTARLVLNTGQGWTPIDLVQVQGNLYVADFPPLPCGLEVQYYIEAQDTDGRVDTTPVNAPAAYHTAVPGASLTTVHYEDFQDLGTWTYTNVNVTGGAWERGIPSGGGDRGDPISDFDGSGRCLITEADDGDTDVDGGPTIAMTPVFDLSGDYEYLIRYARWFTSTGGVPDQLRVEISNNNGNTWVVADAVDNTLGWKVHTFRVSDLVTPSNLVKVRFSIADDPDDSVTEAAIDAFEIIAADCEFSYDVGDVNCDGAINTLDVEPFIEAMTNPDQYELDYPNCDLLQADANGDGAVNSVDIEPFVALLAG
jgi:choice-of-anchor B domain-containing protein